MLYNIKRNNKEVRFNHRRSDVSQKGGITMGWIIHEDVIVYGFAVCSNEDMYNKKTGRELVQSRLESVEFIDESVTFPEYNEKWIAVHNKEELIDFASQTEMLRGFRKDSRSSIKMEDLSFALLIEFAEYSYLS